MAVDLEGLETRGRTLLRGSVKAKGVGRVLAGMRTRFNCLEVSSKAEPKLNIAPGYDLPTLGGRMQQPFQSARGTMTLKSEVLKNPTRYLTKMNK
jgi:hypothetical protein